MAIEQHFWRLQCLEVACQEDRFAIDVHHCCLVLSLGELAEQTLLPGVTGLQQLLLFTALKLQQNTVSAGQIDMGGHRTWGHRT